MFRCVETHLLTLARDSCPDSHPLKDQNSYYKKETNESLCQTSTNSACIGAEHIASSVV